MVSAIVGPEILFFIQYRDQRFYRRWSEWQICSPHYLTCPEARADFEQRTCSEPLWATQLRLVRGQFWYTKLPLKTPLYALHKSKLKVLARKAGQHNVDA